MQDESPELRVQDTNEEALASKMYYRQPNLILCDAFSSAVRKGYFEDAFAEEFVKLRGKRDVIMHRGYWARIYLFKHIVERFLDLSKTNPVQIISLGSGLDTLYFNERINPADKGRNYRYIELDLAQVCLKKQPEQWLVQIHKIQKSEKIMSLLKSQGGVDINHQTATLKSGNYILAPCDLSDAEVFKQTIQKLNIDSKQPTLFFCECVISYIDPHLFNNTLKAIVSTFDLAVFLDYEMFNPKDRFGEMMIKNFKLRGCPLIGIDAYPSLEDQKKRFIDMGFHDVEAYTMLKIYNELLDKKEKARIEKLEFLDEFQEWNIMMGHYFGLVAIHSTEAARASQVNRDLIHTVHIKL